MKRHCRLENRKNTKRTKTHLNTNQTHQTQPDTGPGNTGSGPDPRSRHWVFTWNNYPDTADTDILSWGAEKYIYQPEVGEHGTPHIQGLLSFKNARTLAQLKQKNQGVHWEICRDIKASILYCQKQDTKAGETKAHGFIIDKPIKDPIQQPKDWQQKIIDDCKKTPDDRKIHWIYDAEGGKGKTALCKHLCLKYDAIMVGGKANDVKYAIAERIKEKKSVDIVLVNITRSLEQYVSYESIEAVKDGIFFSGKYESGMCIFNSPHLYVFANFLPDLTKLSMDRWDITDLSTIDLPEDLFE